MLYKVKVKETWTAESEFVVNADSEREAKRLAEDRSGECVVDSEGFNMIDWKAVDAEQVDKS